jgi:hypothetical protein
MMKIAAPPIAPAIAPTGTLFVLPVDIVPSVIVGAGSELDPVLVAVAPAVFEVVFAVPPLAPVVTIAM